MPEPQCEVHLRPRRLQLVLTAALGFWLAWAAYGQDVAGSFDLANKLYEQGKFAEAAAAYEKLSQAGQESPALWFNLGNAYFKGGQVGRAIVAYRRAELLRPRDPDVRANLRFARHQVQGPTVSPGRLDAWLGALTLDEWTLMATAVLWSWLVVLAAGQLRPNLRAMLRGFVLVLAAGFAATVVCLLLAWQAQRKGAMAVVVAPKAEIHQGPFEDSKTTFAVQDGA